MRDGMSSANERGAVHIPSGSDRSHASGRSRGNAAHLLAGIAETRDRGSWDDDGPDYHGSRRGRDGPHDDDDDDDDWQEYEGNEPSENAEGSDIQTTTLHVPMAH